MINGGNRNPCQLILSSLCFPAHSVISWYDVLRCWYVWACSLIPLHGAMKDTGILKQRIRRVGLVQWLVYQFYKNLDVWKDLMGCMHDLLCSYMSYVTLDLRWYLERICAGKIWWDIWGWVTRSYEKEKRAIHHTTTIPPPISTIHQPPIPHTTPYHPYHTHYPPPHHYMFKNSL